jgi:hypothetical protein
LLKRFDIKQNIGGPTLRIINILFAAVIVVCTITVSFGHSIELFSGYGFKLVHAQLSVIAVESLFFMGMLNIIVSRLRRYEPGLPAKLGALIGSCLVGWANVQALKEYGVPGIILGLSTPVVMMTAESILSREIIQSLDSRKSTSKQNTSQESTSSPTTRNKSTSIFSFFTRKKNTSSPVTSLETPVTSSGEITSTTSKTGENKNTSSPATSTGENKAGENTSSPVTTSTSKTGDTISTSFSTSTNSKENTSPTSSTTNKTGEGNKTGENTSTGTTSLKTTSPQVTSSKSTSTTSKNTNGTSTATTSNKNTSHQLTSKETTSVTNHQKTTSRKTGATSKETTSLKLVKPDLDYIKQKALEIYYEEGDWPGRPRLMKAANCKHNQARRALDELKKEHKQLKTAQ